MAETINAMKRQAEEIPRRMLRAANICPNVAFIISPPEIPSFNLREVRWQ
jgi:hypothetical protein